MEDAPKRDTKYATELAHGSVTLSTGTEGRIERLRFKEGPVAGKDGIRFSWWKEGRMVPRPLDTTEDELIVLMRSSLDRGVFSERFLLEIRRMLETVRK